MKLTKNELKDCLNARIKWHRYAEFLRSQGFSGEKNDDFYERYEALLNELEGGTLEIEGYEKSEWIKFDPQDSDTFPPPGHYLCFSTDDGEVNPTYRSDKCTDEIFASLPHDMEYWRPLPKPAIETEGQ